MGGAKIVDSMDIPQVTRLAIPHALMATKKDRRRLSNWLTKNCGRPCPKQGFWWTESIHTHVQPADVGMVICFALPEHAVLFNLTWL